MTDIELRQQGAITPDRPGADPGTDLILWARQAEAAYIYADRVCRTQMVPVAYKGKPDEACAAILAGAELGFGPMASLRAFHPINGTPAPAALTLRAVVTGHGHKVKVLEQSATRAVVTGLRKGDDPEKDWQTSTWDLDRASKLPQFKTNKNYEHNLGAMLIARATAEVCRWIGSDAIMGMPYAAEEAGDFAVIEAAPVARKLTVAELDAAPAAVEQDTAVEPDEPLTDAQRKRMFALWTDLGFSGDENRATRLELTAKFVDLPQLDSSSDLTREQAAVVIARLEARVAQVQAVPAPDAEQ